MVGNFFINLVSLRISISTGEEEIDVNRGKFICFKKRAYMRCCFLRIGGLIKSFEVCYRGVVIAGSFIGQQEESRAIYLFHDTSKTMLEILPAFLRWVKAGGYEIVRLDKMLNLKPYA